MTAAAPVSPTLDRPVSLWTEQRALTIGILMAITLVAFEVLGVATVLPLAREDLGGVRLYGWAFSAFLLASLLGIAWSGAAADRVGPARPFVIGMVLFVAGLVVSGLANSMAVLVAGRAISGLGAGVIPTVVYVCIARAYSEEARSRMLAWLSTAWIVPGLAGPGLAVLAAELANWRIVFLGLLPLLVVASMLLLPALMRLGPPAAPGGTKSNLRSTLLLAASAGMLIAGLSAGTLVAAAGLVLFGLPAMAFALSRSLTAGALRLARGLPAAVIGHGLLNLAFFGTDAFIPFALVTVRDESTILVGIGLTLSAVLWTAGTWSLERLGKRFSRQLAIAVGLLAVSLQGVAMAFAVWPAVPVWVALVSWSVGALGIGLAYPSFSLIVLGLAEKGREGVASGAMKLCESLGAALGAGISGAAVAAGAAFDSERAGVSAAFAIMAVIALLAIPAGLRTRQSPSPSRRQWRILPWGVRQS